MKDNKSTGISSGFEELDSMTGGFQKGELIVIGPWPSVGKTTLALNMAAHIALRNKIPTAFFILEKSDFDGFGKMDEISDDRQVFSSRKIGEVLPEIIDIIDMVFKYKRRLTGISTGLEKSVIDLVMHLISSEAMVRAINCITAS